MTSPWNPWVSVESVVVRGIRGCPWLSVDYIGHPWLPWMSVDVRGHPWDPWLPVSTYRYTAILYYV